MGNSCTSQPIDKNMLIKQNYLISSISDYKIDDIKNALKNDINLNLCDILFVLAETLLYQPFDQFQQILTCLEDSIESSKSKSLVDPSRKHITYTRGLIFANRKLKTSFNLEFFKEETLLIKYPNLFEGIRKATYKNSSGQYYNCYGNNSHGYLENVKLSANDINYKSKHKRIYINNRKTLLHGTIDFVSKSYSNIDIDSYIIMLINHLSQIKITTDATKYRKDIQTVISNLRWFDNYIYEKQQTEKIQITESQQPSQPTLIIPSAPKEESKYDDSDGHQGLNCSICFERVPEIKYDCDHITNCEECAKKISECPICRAPIVTRKRVYVVTV
jgi:hypothetical protein